MYSDFGSSIEMKKLECNIEFVEYMKKSEKNNKKSEKLQLQGEIKEINNKNFTGKKNERGSDLNFQNYSWNF